MFQELFCEHFGCSSAQYEKRALNLLLYSHARILAPLVRVFKPGLFAPDLKFIRRLGQAHDMREATHDLLDFKDASGGRSDPWRGILRLRVSGRKAGRVARELLNSKPSERDSVNLLPSRQ